MTQGRAAGQYWQVDYRLRNDGLESIVIAPAETSAHVTGWVSNSRVAAHATPLRSEVTVTGRSGLSASAEVIAARDESRQCRERVVLQVWPAETGDAPPDPIARATSRVLALSEQPIWTIAPGAVLRVRLRLEHDHFLYGPFDPLLGPRTVALTLGPSSFRDRLSLDRARRVAEPATGWPPPPPPDRMDNRVFVTAPDSLHLEAHIGGHQSYRFPGCPVRYGSKMRLSYWYLIAPGGDGDCGMRLAQYRDAPNHWRTLPDGELEQTLTTVGRWTRVVRTFRTEPEATTLMIEFRHRGEFGDLWVDDVKLEPLDDDPEGP